MKWKWIGIGALILAGIVIGLYFYLRVEKSSDFEPLIKKKLAGLVSRASDGLYVLDMDHIEIDVLESTIKAVDVKLYPDSNRMKTMDDMQMLPDDIFQVQLDHLLITGISPTDFINNKKINVNQVLLDTPAVTITHNKRNYNNPREDTTDFMSRLAPDKQSYGIETLLFRKMRLTYKNQSKNASPVKLNDITARLDNIRLDSATAKDSSRFFFAEKAFLYTNNFSSYSADGMYRTSVDSVAINPQTRTLTAFKYKIASPYSKAEFNKKAGHMRERYDFLVDKIDVKDIDWWSLMNGEGIYGDEVALTGGHINIYLDRGQPPSGKSKVGNYPHQMVMQLEKPVDINMLRVNGMFVSYEERNPKTGQSGVIEFNNAHGTIGNITNIPSSISANSSMRAEAHAKFMNRASVDAVFIFNLAAHKSGNFTVNAEIGSIDGTALNEASRALALVEIKRGQMDRLKADIDGNNNQGHGKVSFAYHDLKISALKKDDDGDLKKRGLFSFLANTFVVKEDGKDPPEVYDVTYQRDTERSFFNVVWQTISLGVVKAVRGK